MEAFNSIPPFSLRDDYLGQAARNWFGVTTLTVNRPKIALRNQILYPYQFMVAFIHLLFIINLFAFLLTRGIRSVSRFERHLMLVSVALLMCDLIFNLTAAATVMRYEIFGVFIEVSLSLWLIERIYSDHLTA